MVSRWSRNEKSAIIGDYGDANLINGSESEGKINRILTDSKVNQILISNGLSIMPREGGAFDSNKYGFEI